MDRVEARIDGLQAEMGRRFDAVDVRFNAIEQVLISLQTQISDLHRQMLQLHGQAVSRIDALGVHMRVLHEDTIDRISKINRG